MLEQQRKCFVSELLVFIQREFPEVSGPQVAHGLVEIVAAIIAYGGEPRFYDIMIRDVLYHLRRQVAQKAASRNHAKQPSKPIPITLN
jgi:hypothetical protein